VIFNSDNGFMLGEHRQRGKVDLYEESARVPLIIRGPRAPEGKTRRQIVGNVDIAPTILDIANAEPLRTPDGLSLLPFMARANHYKDRVILLENRDSQGVRTRRYVYIEHHRGGDEIVHWELYDLKHDPFQLQNLIGPNDTQTRLNLPRGVKPGEVQEVRTNLAGLLDRLRDCTGSACAVP
jgi:arylsulfatase A-like enzyme